MMVQFKVHIATQRGSVTYSVSAPTGDEAILAVARRVFVKGSKVECRNGVFLVCWKAEDGTENECPFSGTAWEDSAPTYYRSPREERQRIVD